MDAASLIAELALEAHPEGGWYRETWRDRGGAGSAIYLLLRRGERSDWHRVTDRAEVWHFYAGSPLRLETRPGGVVVLGGDITAGERPQTVVAPGSWQSAETIGAWTLAGVTVSPAVDPSAVEVAPPAFDPGAAGPPPSNVGTMVTTNPSSGTPLHTSETSGSRNTLAFDIGGTGLKASVVDDVGHMEHDRVRIDTPYPLAPDKLVTLLADLVKGLPPFDRISAGFPGMVRDGKILSAPHFISPEGPEGKPSSKLTKAWIGYNLQAAISAALGKPTKVANDADVQGSAVVDGHGLELVVTLGTGIGTALFYEGTLLPHLEFAHHPLRKNETYNEALGNDARKSLGTKKWNKRVAEMIDTLRALTFFDHCYLGGGNAARVDFELPADVSVVDNDAGIVGGIKLWERTP